MGADEILRRYVPDFKQDIILMKLMGELQEAIMQARQLRKRFCAYVYGGKLCTTIPRCIVRYVMHVKELADHREEMSFHYILKYLCRHLRSGKLLLLGQFIPWERKWVHAILSP